MNRLAFSILGGLMFVSGCTNPEVTREVLGIVPARQISDCYDARTYVEAYGTPGDPGPCWKSTLSVLRSEGGFSAYTVKRVGDGTAVLFYDGDRLVSAAEG